MKTYEEFIIEFNNQYYKLSSFNGLQPKIGFIGFEFFKFLYENSFSVYKLGIKQSEILFPKDGCCEFRGVILYRAMDGFEGIKLVPAL